MRLPRLRATSAALAAGLVALSVVALTPAPAQAHKHPTPAQLVSPAVVRIQVYGHVSISLIENSVTGRYSSDTKLVQRAYEPLLTTGSGFVVNPGGTVVTSPTVTGVDLQRAVVFAVNKIFAERYGDGAPLPADPYSKAPPRPNSGDSVSQRLQRCYQPNTTDATGGCVVFVGRKVVVQPFVASQAQYGNLTGEVIYPTDGKKSDVSIIKVGANSMPSVNLGQTVGQSEALGALGFTTAPADEKSLTIINAHLMKAGDTVVKNDEFAPKIRTGLQNGMLGGPVVNEKGLVVGFLTDGPKNLSLTPVDSIQTALAQLNITPGRGPTDGVYENALHNFNNQFYTAAAANLTQVLKLYPGDALAAEKLVIANQRKGTSADKGSASSSGGDSNGFGPASGSSGSPNLLLWGGGAAVVVLAVLLLVVLIRGRRKPGAGTPAGIPQGVPGGPPGEYQPGMLPAGGYPGAEPGAFAVPGVPGYGPGLPGLAGYEPPPGYGPGLPGLAGYEPPPGYGPGLPGLAGYEPPPGYGPGLPGYGPPPGYGPAPVSGQPGMVPGQYPPLGTPYPATPTVPAGYGNPAAYGGATSAPWEEQTMRYLSPSAPSSSSGQPVTSAPPAANPPSPAPAGSATGSTGSTGSGTGPDRAPDRAADLVPDDARTMVVSNISDIAHSGAHPGASTSQGSNRTGTEPSTTNPPGAVAEALTGGSAVAAGAQTVIARPDLSMLNCTHCDQPVQAGQQFCAYCGNRAR